MNKKFISVIMAAILAVSATAVSASAAEVEEEPSKASGTFFFDATDWGTPANLCFYIWDNTTDEYAANGKGWSASNKAWGSAKKLGGTPVEGKPGVYESYEIDLSGREDHAVYVIFHNKDTDAQTFNCLINDSVFGCTAKRNGVMYENPVDSEKKTEGVEWDGGSGLGAAKLITSSGKVQGEVIAPGTDTAATVAQFVIDYLGKKEKITGDDIVTEETVANAISAFGTDADAVWEKYLTHNGEDNYNEEEAKKVIKPTSGSGSGNDSSDSDSDSDSDSSNTSSNSSNTSSSSGSTTKASTTTGTSTTGTSATGTTTGGSADTAATGDTRGVVAFAGVLVAAAGTIIATRKKIED